MSTREVTLEGGAPWGFRMHGGVDQHQPLKISRVNPGSKASCKGIREGDVITSVNGRSTKNLTNTEAHAILKNSGNTLTLGLNEDLENSPKRRQYRTVQHQESFQETVKRSTVTTYSSIKTVEKLDSPSDKDNNEQPIEADKDTTITSIGDASIHLPPSDLLVTKRPGSSSSSTPTLTKEDLKTYSSDNALASERSSYTNCTLSPSSHSLFSEDGARTSIAVPPVDETKQIHRVDNMNEGSKRSSRSRKRRQRRRRAHNADNDKPDNEDYTVQSPTELDTKKKNKPVKSRSLDDEDDGVVKIQEVSGDVDGCQEAQAIVSEASESEVEWEETENLDTPPPVLGALSTLTLPLEGCVSEQIATLSPHEEKTLRSFLEGLNLINGPEEAADRVSDKAEDAKERKARKRAELEKYFLPIYQNPRYLEVISEESRESSDRECEPKAGTSGRRDVRKALPNPVVLVDTKLKEHNEENEPVYSNVASTNVEVVYLTSSETESEEQDSDSYVLASEKHSSNEDLSDKTLVDYETDDINNAQNLNDTPTTLNVIEDNKETTLTNEQSTKDNTTINKIEDAKETKVTSRELNNTNNNAMLDERLLNQLTPPPTPDNASPEESLMEPSPINNTDSAVKAAITTKVLTPPPPSRSSSSSRSSSICTIKHNSSTSSMADVMALAKETERFRVVTLREICVNFLLSLPFGREILEELADVSKCIDSYTSSLPSVVLPKLAPNRGLPTNSNSVSCKLSVQSHPGKFPPRKKKQEEITYVKTSFNEGKNVDKSAEKVVIIPVQVEEKLKSDVKDVKLDDTFESKEALRKEYIIPIKTCNERDEEIKTSPTNPVTNQVETTNIIKEERNEKKIVNIHEQYQEDKTSNERIQIIKKYAIPVQREQPKEVIIPITKEIDNSKTNKPKEFVIPIMKEGHTDKKDISVPIRKESLKFLQKSKQTTTESSTPEQQEIKPKEHLIPITRDNDKQTYQNWTKTTPKQKEDKKNTTTKSSRSIQIESEHKEHIIPIKLDTKKETGYHNWTGLRCEEDPKVLLCLSPKQKDQLESTKQIPQEADKLIDLHSKFINRKTPHAQDSRLLTIINEEPNRLPPQESRLAAKDLMEWLSLARCKSTSLVDLTENNPRSAPDAPRRPSLPQDIFEKQMLYIREKEREIERQLQSLEEEKLLLGARMEPSRPFRADDYCYSRRGDFAETKKRPASMPAMPTEFFRQQMYEEYLGKFAEREERKQHKIIKVTSSKDLSQESALADRREIVHPVQIEEEFMDKVMEMRKGGKLEETKDNNNNNDGNKKEVVDEPPVLVIDGETLKDTKELPKHLQEFVGADGIWSPGQKIDLSPQEKDKHFFGNRDESIPPVWTPKSANSSPVAERKEFRPVNFQSPTLSRRNRTASENQPPRRNPDYSSDTGSASSVLDRRLPASRSTPATGFYDFSRLPKAQNPTITLLQKAREGQLPKGASYIEHDPRHFRPKDDRPPIAGPGEILYQIKNEYTSESDNERPRKMTDLSQRKFEGIGPVTKDGIPLVLRSDVKDQNQSKWYKRMYDTIHKQPQHNDEYVTIRYKQKRAQYPYTSGYLSEPEPGSYDSDFTDYKYQTLDRRRPLPQDRSLDYVNSTTMPRTIVNRSSSSDIHKQQDYLRGPGKIENYVPGRSSIAEKETKQWWDEVMDIFDGHLEQQKQIPHSHPKSFINQCLKDGYESDSTLVFRRKEETVQRISPKEQREAYKVIQKGGDVPLRGLRKPAPEKPKEPEPPVPPVPPPKGLYARKLEESPRKYVENEVTIHYKTPVRQEIKDCLSEDELAHRQAEAMKKIYQEERRKKYLQELQDMNSRRHTDNFIPSQKSPISLNRYDDFDDLAPTARPRPRSPEHRLCARALYNFVGQSARELTFRKGDVIYLRRQIDKNWYEGELNAMVGLFPTNYVEIVPFDGTKSKPTLRKAHEGQARAKYNFVAQTHLELSLAKGELVTITRKVDENWYEGKIGGRKGIFPANYVEILIDPHQTSASSKPVASPAAHSLLLNGSAGGKESMGAHSYTPLLNSSQSGSSYRAKPAQVVNDKNPGLDQTLHIETQNEPVPFRAVYKYKPQNDDELELMEGDTVFVLEKCDDGWYVGSSERTGAFGTFPGNYVEKM
ncbi:unnamed protein product [Phyllotreta striolata]|uniref:Sorbin and SH3 domain-containing protein 1 n=1 Tax=Phyllotreta striolata TaxID=444603 RepID=A0A9N9TKK9_PHYSR|nr:unnamed protein product [Phyllotreta striolata]